MRLSIIAPDTVYEPDVDSSMEVRDLQALLKAEMESTGAAPPSGLILTTDSGVVLSVETKSLKDYGLTGDSTLYLTYRDTTSLPSSSTQHSAQDIALHSDQDFERMRLQALGDQQLMQQLRTANPEFAAAIQSGGPQFRELLRRQQQMIGEKERQIELLNADPYDIEAQKKIEEAIRMEAVLENMHHAMEFSPESFGHVTMLYINVEVNGHPVKAFVDSGAQTTIISPECAEACGIMRLIDKRFAGVAQGVGTANILGRIHSAQIRLGNLFLPVAFSVLEGQSVDLLFGLDMLKRHQACIDLSTNTLRIGSSEIHFLSEHELPESARQRATLADAPNAPAQPIAPPPPTSTPVAGPSAPTRSSHSEEAVQTIMALGADRSYAIQLLDAAHGNVDVAASMLFE